MEQPSYFSILTADIRYDPQLVKKPELQVMYSEITALSNKWGYCTASNKYFTELYQVDITTISRRISKLVELGYLKRVLVRDGKQIKERRLYPVMNRVLASTPIGGIDVNAKRGIGVNAKENNININKEEEEIYKEKENKLSLLEDLKHFVNSIPTEGDWQTIKLLSNRLTYEGLRFVALNFNGIMHDKGERISKPYSYLIKMMREEIESERAR